MTNATVVNTRIEKLKEITNYIAANGNTVVSEHKLQELFKTFLGREAHGQYSNMSEIYVLSAVNAEDVVTNAQYKYYDAATGGAYPTPALELKKGVAELPVDWKEIRITIRRHRNNSNDWVKNGTFIVAEKNDNGTCLLHTLPELY